MWPSTTALTLSSLFRATPKVRRRPYGSSHASATNLYVVTRQVLIIILLQGRTRQLIVREVRNRAEGEYTSVLHDTEITLSAPCCYMFVRSDVLGSTVQLIGMQVSLVLNFQISLTCTHFSATKLQLMNPLSASRSGSDPRLHLTTDHLLPCPTCWVFETKDKRQQRHAQMFPEYQIPCLGTRCSAVVTPLSHLERDSGFPGVLVRAKKCQ